MPITFRAATPDTLTFRYTVQASDFDNDGITVANRLERNGGTIRDTSGHDAGLRFVPPDTPRRAGQRASGR
jgi:hypothetical protein